MEKTFAYRRNNNRSINKIFLVGILCTALLILAAYYAVPGFANILALTLLLSLGILYAVSMKDNFRKEWIEGPLILDDKGLSLNINSKTEHRNVLIRFDSISNLEAVLIGRKYVIYTCSGIKYELELSKFETPKKFGEFTNILSKAYYYARMKAAGVDNPKDIFGDEENPVR